MTFSSCKFWFHLMYIRTVHGFLQLLYMYSGNCGILFFMLSMCFHFNISSAWFLLHISISRVPFLSILKLFFGFKLFDIFSILNGHSLLRGISSADSITMKDGKFLLSHCQNFPRVFLKISLAFLCAIHIIRCEFYWTCSQPTDVPKRKPIHLATSGLHVQYTHAGVRKFYFVSGFSFQR